MKAKTVITMMMIYAYVSMIVLVFILIKLDEVNGHLTRVDELAHSRVPADLDPTIFGPSPDIDSSHTQSYVQPPLDPYIMGDVKVTPYGAIVQPDGSDPHLTIPDNSPGFYRGGDTDFSTSPGYFYPAPDLKCPSADIRCLK